MRFYRRTAFAFNVIVICIAGLALIGWQFGVEIFKRPLPYLVAMNPATAVTFIFSACGFFFLARNKVSKMGWWIGMISAAFVVAIGSLKLIEFHSGWNVGVDQFLFIERLQDDIKGNLSNAMAANTAFCFILTGLALFYINRSSGRQQISLFLAVLMGFIAFLVVLGYLYGDNAFLSILSEYPMALHTALCFILIAAAIILRLSKVGFMTDFTSGYAGGYMSRLLIPTAILVPLLLGVFRILAEEAGWSGVNSGAGLVAVLGIGLLLFFIWKSSHRINQIDIARTDAEADLKMFNYRLEARVRNRTKNLN